MHIFFSVGEPSGDQHAAHLIGELRRRRPDVRASGFGGPLMEQAGCRLDYRLTELAVMGLLRVLPLLWRFYMLVRQARRLFREQRPDAVVLVDFPGFNWWIARAAKAEGIPVFYYLPPQLWAWAPWRVRRMRRFVDHVLCGLPFEPAWYAERGLKVEYVGHPFFDEVAEYPLDRDFCRTWQADGGPVVGVLPGSRNQEVTRNWPLMLDVMRRLHARHPQVRFLVACYRDSHRAFCESLSEKGDRHPPSHGTSGLSTQHPGASPPFRRDLPIHFFVGRTPEVIETADCCLMVSGSVSLEMLARRTPAVVLYRLGWMALVMMRLLLRVTSITLPNLIAGRRVLPEWVVASSPDRDVQEMTDMLDGWLSDPARLAEAVQSLTDLHRDVVQTGATSRAAEAILSRLGPSSIRRAA